MALIKPFKALRPHNQYAKQVASKPYDVLNSEEAKKEAADNLLSFLHVTKPEIDLPADTDIYSEEVYQKGAANLAALIGNHILFREAKPTYYIYELAWRGRSQTGLVCLSSIADYHNNVILKHEFTRPEKEQDRIDHMIATKAQTGNVFLACKTVKELDDVFNHWKKQHNAEYNFLADDGVAHAIWVVDDVSTIDIITHLFLEKIPFTYIADGHHRAASAAKVSREFPGNADAEYFLTTIFPANQLAILDYNRVVKDLNNLGTEEFLEKLSAEFSVQKTGAAFQPKEPHEFGMFLDGSWYSIKAKEGTYASDPIGVLDVSILQQNVFNKILGITDPRTDKRLDFVGGIRGLKELEDRVKNGDMKAAFSLHPLSIQQLFDIADSGNVMPPKSTWFEPKLRDGLLTHLLS